MVLRAIDASIRPTLPFKLGRSYIYTLHGYPARRGLKVSNKREKARHISAGPPRAREVEGGERGGGGRSILRPSKHFRVSAWQCFHCQIISVQCTLPTLCVLNHENGSDSF